MAAGQQRQLAAREDHGGQLFWSQAAGNIPFRGEPRLMRGDEAITKVQNVADFKCREFLLWDAVEREEFRVVMERAYAGWYAVTKRVDRWDETNHGYLVWLEWLQIYKEPTMSGGLPSVDSSPISKTS